MLRITQSPTVQLTIINLEGKLLTAWIEEAQSAVETAKRHGPVKLNLHELNFADRDGVKLLRRFREDGIELINAPALIEGMLSMPE